MPLAAPCLSRHRSRRVQRRAGQSRTNHSSGRCAREGWRVTRCRLRGWQGSRYLRLQHLEQLSTCAGHRDRPASTALRPRSRWRTMTTDPRTKTGAAPSWLRVTLQGYRGRPRMRSASRGRTARWTEDAKRAVELCYDLTADLQQLRSSRGQTLSKPSALLLCCSAGGAARV